LCTSRAWSRCWTGVGAAVGTSLRWQQCSQRKVRSLVTASGVGGPVGPPSPPPRPHPAQPPPGQINPRRAASGGRRGRGRAWVVGPKVSPNPPPAPRPAKERMDAVAAASAAASTAASTRHRRHRRHWRHRRHRRAHSTTLTHLEDVNGPRWCACARQDKYAMRAILRRAAHAHQRGIFAIGEKRRWPLSVAPSLRRSAAWLRGRGGEEARRRGCLESRSLDGATKKLEDSGARGQRRIVWVSGELSRCLVVSLSRCRVASLPRCLVASLPRRRESGGATSYALRPRSCCCWRRRGRRGGASRPSGISERRCDADGSGEAD
jgi:hypothetical protein